MPYKTRKSSPIFFEFKLQVNSNGISTIDICFELKHRLISVLIHKTNGEVLNIYRVV